jgi:hypothetical protein
MDYSTLLELAGRWYCLCVLQNINGTLDPPAICVSHGGCGDLDVVDINSDRLVDIIVMSGQLYAILTSAY